MRRLLEALQLILNALFPQRNLGKFREYAALDYSYLLTKLNIASFCSYDGGAPAVYWWGAPDCNVATIKKEGFRISDQQLDKKYNNAEVWIELNTNETVSKCSVPTLKLCH